MVKSKRINSFFKRKNASTLSKIEKLHENPKIEENEKQLSKVPKVRYNEFENALERAIEKHIQIWQYPPNQIDEVQRAYLKWGPYQMHLENYSLSSKDDHLRRFKYTWFSLFLSWLEYSLLDVAYCLPCYLFSKKPSR